MKLVQIKLLLLGVTVLSISSCKKEPSKKNSFLQKETRTQSNIVFIVSDDHAYQAIGAYGHGVNNTPNIDRIAKEGAVFNKGFVTSYICAPSRVVMLTGKYSYVNGKVDTILPFNRKQDNFLKAKGLKI